MVFMQPRGVDVRLELINHALQILARLYRVCETETIRATIKTFLDDSRRALAKASSAALDKLNRQRHIRSSSSYTISSAFSALNITPRPKPQTKAIEVKPEKSRQIRLTFQQYHAEFRLPGEEAQSIREICLGCGCSEPPECMYVYEITCVEKRVYLCRHCVLKRSAMFCTETKWLIL
jgi:hypothetical protein